jgi:hypothetical protein
MGLAVLSPLIVAIISALLSTVLYLYCIRCLVVQLLSCRVISIFLYLSFPILNYFLFQDSTITIFRRNLGERGPSVWTAIGVTELEHLERQNESLECKCPPVNMFHHVDGMYINDEVPFTLTLEVMKTWNTKFRHLLQDIVGNIIDKSSQVHILITIHRIRMILRHDDRGIMNITITKIYPITWRLVFRRLARLMCARLLRENNLSSPDPIMPCVRALEKQISLIISPAFQHLDNMQFTYTELQDLKGLGVPLCTINIYQNMSKKMSSQIISRNIIHQQHLCKHKMRQQNQEKFQYYQQHQQYHNDSRQQQDTEHLPQHCNDDSTEVQILTLEQSIEYEKKRLQQQHQQLLRTQSILPSKTQSSLPEDQHIIVSDEIRKDLFVSYTENYHKIKDFQSEHIKDEVRTLRIYIKSMIDERTRLIQNNISFTECSPTLSSCKKSTTSSSAEENSTSSSSSSSSSKEPTQPYPSSSKETLPPSYLSCKEYSSIQPSSRESSSTSSSEIYSLNVLNKLLNSRKKKRIIVQKTNGNKNVDIDTCYDRDAMRKINEDADGSGCMDADYKEDDNNVNEFHIGCNNENDDRDDEISAVINGTSKGTSVRTVSTRSNTSVRAVSTASDCDISNTSHHFFLNHHSNSKNMEGNLKMCRKRKDFDPCQSEKINGENDNRNIDERVLNDTFHRGNGRRQQQQQQHQQQQQKEICIDKNNTKDSIDENTVRTNENAVRKFMRFENSVPRSSNCVEHVLLGNITSISSPVFNLTNTDSVNPHLKHDKVTDIFLNNSIDIVNNTNKIEPSHETVTKGSKWACSWCQCLNACRKKTCRLCDTVKERSTNNGSNYEWEINNDDNMAADGDKSTNSKEIKIDLFNDRVNCIGNTNKIVDKYNKSLNSDEHEIGIYIYEYIYTYVYMYKYIYVYG